MLKAIKNNLLKDGLEEVDWSDIDPLKGCFCSAVLRENEEYRNGDFHFYAWEKGGNCSHKQGHDPVVWIAENLRGPDDLLINGYNKYIGTFAVPDQGIYYHPKPP